MVNKAKSESSPRPRANKIIKAIKNNKAMKAIKAIKANKAIKTINAKKIQQR